MPIERRDGCRLWIGGPVPPGAAALTVGSWVLIRPGHERDELLLRHELVHVDQYRRQGTVRFLVRYVGAYVGLRWRRWPHLAAYRRIPAEIEAEWRSRRSAPANRP